MMRKLYQVYNLKPKRKKELKENKEKEMMERWS